jgi:protein TonB
VRKIDLFSKEWCDQIFHGRNKDYGAYQLRATAGRRYRRALIILFVGFFLCVGLPIGIQLYAKYKLFKSAKDFEKEIPKLKKLEFEARPDHEVKMLSAGRGRPKISTIVNATDNVGEIVEQTDNEIVIGIKGEETINVEDWVSEWEDLDTTHNLDQLDLPIEGPQLIEVDKVEEMPSFPGGIKALMTWMDQNIPYPQTCKNSKVRGLMEVLFIVDDQGYPNDFQITKSLHPDLDKLVLAAMKRMPKWQPAMHNGTPCRAAVTLPIHFEPK